MRHPTDGTLRRLVDEPHTVPDADREHVAACPVCLRTLAEVQRDAQLVAATLRAELTTPDVDSAWARLSASLAADTTTPPIKESVRPKWSRLEKSSGMDGTDSLISGRARRRVSLRSPAVAVAGALVLLTGAGAAAAADWLPIFRTERIAPTAVTRADLVGLPDLSAYGDLQVVQGPEVREVDGAAAAAQQAGVPAPSVRQLPRGVTGEPTYQVGRRVSVVFTFSAAKARAAAGTGTTPEPPAGLDGSRFRLTAGPGLVAIWRDGRGLPALAVGRAVAPAAESSGVPFDTARDYLLSLPGLPPALAQQLRDFDATGSTLPLPVPVDRATSSPTDVNGAPATLLTTRDGSMAGVIWVEKGVVTAVAGSLSGDEVLAVARALGAA